MAKFLEAVISSLVLLALLAAGVWFGGPAIFKHLAESEAARGTVKVQAQALDADAASISQRQAECAAQAHSSLKAGVVIQRLSQPAPKPRLITAKDIEDALQ